MPRFSILNPRYTMTLPHYQMVSGIYDIFNHICEQYFSGEDDKKGTFIMTGGYKKLDKEEIEQIFRESLKKLILLYRYQLRVSEKMQCDT